MTEKLKKFLKNAFHKIVHLDDSPHRIAGGFAVGVFLGILPAAGPVAAIVLAWALRVNRAAAFAGGLLTNGWISLITFVAAIKIGAFVTGADWHAVYADCKRILQNFNWRELFDESILELLKPLFAGYLVIGLVLGLAAYIIAYYVVVRRRRRLPPPMPS